MNRIIAAVGAAVVILAGAGYFIFLHEPGGGDRVSGEELRAYVEEQFAGVGATFDAVTYDEGSDTVTVTALDWGGAIPFYKEFKIATFKIKGGDKRALELLFDEAKAAETGNGKFRRVAKKISAENIAFTLDMTAFAKMGMPEAEAEVEKALGGLRGGGTIESSVIEDYAVKPSGESWSALFSVPDLSSPETMNAFMARAAKLAMAQKYGRNEAKGIKYRVEMEEGSAEFNIESIASDGYDAGVVGKTEMGPATLVVDGEEVREELGGAVTASVDGAMIERMDMAKLMAAMQEGALIPQDPKKTPILSPWTPTFGDYKVSGVKVSVPNIGDFTLEELSAQDVQNIAGIALGGRGKLKNLVIPAAALADTGAKPVLDALGAEELRINITGESTFDEKENIWDVSRFLIEVDKFGSLDIQFRFGGMGFVKDLAGMTGEEFEASGMQQRIMQEMTFARLHLDYRDQGAVDYLLKTMTEQSGADRSQLSQQYVQQFDAMRAQFGESAALDQLSAALGTFIQEPKSLTLTFNPEEPMTFAEITAVAMATPVQLVERLGFTAKANQ